MDSSDVALSFRVTSYAYTHPPHVRTCHGRRAADVDSPIARRIWLVHQKSIRTVSSTKSMAFDGPVSRMNAPGKECV